VKNAINTLFPQLFLVNYCYFFTLNDHPKARVSIQDIVSAARLNTTGSSCGENSALRGQPASGYFAATPQPTKDVNIERANLC